MYFLAVTQPQNVTHMNPNMRALTTIMYVPYWTQNLTIPKKEYFYNHITSTTFTEKLEEPNCICDYKIHIMKISCHSKYLVLHFPQHQHSGIRKLDRNYPSDNEYVQKHLRRRLGSCSELTESALRTSGREAQAQTLSTSSNARSPPGGCVIIPANAQKKSRRGV